MPKLRFHFRALSTRKQNIIDNVPDFGNYDDMSNDFTDTFFAWSDSNGITRDQIAEATGNSPKTISTWRSIGIPKGKRLGCQSLIDQHHSITQLQDERSNIQFKPSHSQFKRWNQAALDQGKLIEDWAFEGLEQMAEEHFNSKLKVAESEQSTYNKPGKDEDKPA